MPGYDDEIDLWSLGRRAWQLKWFVLAVTIMLPVAVTAVILTRPKMYEATATVMVTASRLDAALGRAPLPMDAYNQMANSESVRDAVRRASREKGIPPSAIGPDTLRSELYPARDSARPFLPWIGLTAISADASQAQLVANEWAAQVIAAASGFVPADTAQQIVEEHADASAALAKAETALRAAQDRHLRANAEADVTYRQPQKVAELQSRHARALTLENAIADNRASLEDVRERIAQLERELKGLGQMGSVTAALTEQVARERSIFSGLRARDAVFQQQLRDARAEVAKLQRENADITLALDRLAAQQARELEPLYRAVADAHHEAERFDRAYAVAARTKGQPAAHVTLRDPAPLPQQPRARPYRYAILSIPFALLASLGCVFVVAVVKESHNRRLMEQTA